MNDLKGIIEDCHKSDLVSDKVIKKVIEIIGQEKWQILHDENDDICTTMGELIITLKDIVDLEKENADLKEEINKIAFTRGNLEEENKELQDKLEMGIALKDEEIGCIQTDFNTFKSEAKEIIKKLIEAIHIWDYKNLEQVETEAEQFLNSEVEK